MKWLKRLFKREEVEEDLLEELEEPEVYDQEDDDEVASYVEMVLSSFWTVEIIDPKHDLTDLYGIFESPADALKVLEVSLSELNAILETDEEPWDGRIRSVFPV